MRTETKYIADDGTPFDFRQDCIKYEEEKIGVKYEVLKEYIILLNNSGTIIPYSPFRTPTYVYVKKVPDVDDEIYDLMAEVLSEELLSAIYSFDKTGWYTQDDYEQWQNWEHYIARALRIQEKMKELEENL